jgi:hypothetical protein
MSQPIPPELQPNSDGNLALLNWLFGIVTVLVGWVSARLWSGLEAVRTMQAAAAASFVPRAEMQKHMDDLRDEVNKDIEQALQMFYRMHGENRERFTSIDNSLVRLHDRLNGGSRSREKDHD